VQNKKLLSALLALCLLLALPAGAYADASVNHMQLENLQLSVDGGEARTVRTIHYGYDYNRYVSLRDVAAALSGTEKHFDMSITNDQVLITTGRDYTPAGGEGEPFPENYVYTTRPLALYLIWLDGRELHYMSFLGLNSASRLDCFMSLTDLAMQLDLSLEVSAEGMRLNSGEGFTIDLETLRESGFYYEIHSALVGDATTGAIFTAWEPLLSVPIASTTKLMSFAVIMDAVSDGEISFTDSVTIPEEAARLSRLPDGVIYMQTGQVSTVPDLLCAMLILSSNESALTLAIHTAGSEAAFVERMNRKAQTLGLSEGTIFYNCHGLPVYTDNLAATKVQNRMSANDMFELVRYILRTYPEITRITSLKSVHLESFDRTIANTNTLLFNLPGVVGLKTGTTNMSGACLVTAMEAQDKNGETHMLVSIEFGAEDGTVRTTLSEEMLRYGAQRLKEEASPSAAPTIPTDAEALILAVLRSF